MDEENNDTNRRKEINLEDKRPAVIEEQRKKIPVRVSPAQSNSDLLKKHMTYPTLHDSDGGDKQDSPAPSQTSMVAVPHL